MSALKRPTPAKVDELIRRFAELQGRALAATAVARGESAAVDVVKAELVAMVQAFGVRHAEKSQRLTGIRNTATTTTGTMVVVDDAAVDKFKGYLDGVELPGLRERFFSERVTYQLVDGPGDVLKTLDLAARVRNRIKRLVDGCFVVRTKSASLKVSCADGGGCQ